MAEAQDWQSWIQGVASTVLNTAVEVKYKQPYELQKMQLAAYGPFGIPYNEGQANRPQGAPAQIVQGIPNGWLIVGALVAVFALAD